MVKECFPRPKENYLLSRTVHPDTLHNMCELSPQKTLGSSELFSHTSCTLWIKRNMVSKEENKQRRDQPQAKETENVGEEGLVRRSQREMGTWPSWHSILKKVGSREYFLPLQTLEEVDRDGSVAAGQTLELKARMSSKTWNSGYKPQSKNIIGKKNRPMEYMELKSSCRAKGTVKRVKG